MSMPENKEQYIQILQEVQLEKLQNDTGCREEAIKNACYCMALCHLFSTGLLIQSLKIWVWLILLPYVNNNPSMLGTSGISIKLSLKSYPTCYEYAREQRAVYQNVAWSLDWKAANLHYLSGRSDQNVCFCMALCHLFTAGLLKQSLEIWVWLIFTPVY